MPAEDLIGRNFTASAPGEKLVGDITYIPTDEGWLCLATWRDPAIRIAGCSMAGHHCAFLVVDALGMAVGRGRLKPGCIAHSDRGSEYEPTPTWCRPGWSMPSRPARSSPAGSSITPTTAVSTRPSM